MPSNSKLSPAMEYAVLTLKADGYIENFRSVGPTRKRITTGTIVALMDRGIVREQDRYGRHYPATTPEQVHAEAEAENNRRICAGDTVERVNERGPQHPHGKVLTLSDAGLMALVSFSGMQPGWITVDSLRRDVPSYDEMAALVDEAWAEDDERAGGWGQPDGMMGTLQADMPPVVAARPEVVPMTTADLTDEERAAGYTVEGGAVVSPEPDEFEQSINAALADIADLQKHLTPTGIAAEYRWTRERFNRIETALRTAAKTVR